MIDGFSGPCSVAFNLVGGGLAAQCPGNACEGFGTNAQGQTKFVQFYAFAGGPSGYFNGPDLANGINALNGMIATDQYYQGYMRMNHLDQLNAQLLAAMNALIEQGANDNQLAAFINVNSKNFGQITLNGGNFDFNGADLFNFGCSNNRCDEGALGTLDFSHMNGTFHLDTADPYNFPGGTLVHFGVDVLGGNLWYPVVPRP